MLEDFEQELNGLIDDLRALTGFTVLWKDADATLRRALDRKLVEHRHPYCLAVKEDPGRAAACRRHDLLSADHWAGRAPDAMEAGICHAGVLELRAPVFDQGKYLGTLFIGVGQGRETSPVKELARAWKTLPAAVDEQAMRETARLARRGIRLLAAARSLEVEHPARGSANDPVREVLLLLYRNARADYRIDDLAQRVHLSSSRLVHAVRERTGEPFRVIRERAVMRRAARLLLSSDASAARIADLLGFASPAYFSTAFKRATGRSPSEFRAAEDRV